MGRREAPIEDYSSLFLGLLALLTLWILFALARKMVGVVVLTAVAICAWFVLSDPALLENLMDAAPAFFAPDDKGVGH